jgi:hypothetical protein
MRTWLLKSIHWPWSSKTNDLAAFLLLQGALAWPCAVAAGLVTVRQQYIPVEPVSGALGYTFSLILFWGPCIAFGAIAHALVKDKKRWFSFWMTIAILCPIGFVLDLIFGRVFLKFPNRAAVIASKAENYFHSRPIAA